MILEITAGLHFQKSMSNHKCRLKFYHRNKVSYVKHYYLLWAKAQVQNCSAVEQKFYILFSLLFITTISIRIIYPCEIGSVHI